MAADIRNRDPSTTLPQNASVTPSSPSPSPSTPVSTPANNLKRYNTGTSPPASANVLPGGTENTAGGHTRELNFTEAAKSIKVEDFTKLHKQPCVRDSLLAGIGGGFGVGGLRAVLGASILKSCNWAVGSFATVSFIMYEYCQYRRHTEISNMRMAAAVLEKKHAEREEQMKHAREARRRAKEEADRKAEESRKKSSWKFW
ncbi:MAG: hypothetical protein M1817_004283 [Caeruleum heppii]|nr:MAG: hypothetical protein M1817_004283 [Caeruleum heppii]